VQAIERHNQTLELHLLRLLRREAVEREAHRLLQVPRQELVLLLQVHGVGALPPLPAATAARQSRIPRRSRGEARVLSAGLTVRHAGSGPGRRAWLPRQRRFAGQPPAAGSRHRRPPGRLGCRCGGALATRREAAGQLIPAPRARAAAARAAQLVALVLRRDSKQRVSSEPLKTRVFADSWRKDSGLAFAWHRWQTGYQAQVSSHPSSRMYMQDACKCCACQQPAGRCETCHRRSVHLSLHGQLR